MASTGILDNSLINNELPNHNLYNGEVEEKREEIVENKALGHVLYRRER